jgi:glycosyltransferase involved in cell wall biosynthesis
MKIGIDFTAALADATGVGNYTLALTRALWRRRGGDEFVLAVHAFRHPGWRRKTVGLLGDGAPGIRFAVNRLLPHRAVLEGNLRWGLPRVEHLFGDLDVFHGTNFLAPPSRRTRTVVTVHDLAFLRFPAEVRVAHGYVRYLAPAVARADRVVVPSEAVHRDVVGLLRVPPARVAIVPEGAPETLPLLSPEEFTRVRRRLGLPGRYFLFVGTLEPRKNLVRLLAAHREASRRLPDPVGLVLAGRRGWATGEIDAALSAAGGRAPVLWTGFVPEAVRNSLLANATAFAFPSLYEGFGLPVLEAFAAGAPVVCSTGGALPEVAGDAALLSDPRDIETLAGHLVAVAADAGLAEDLRRRGRRRLAAFSWDRAAEETRRAYDVG